MFVPSNICQIGFKNFRSPAHLPENLEKWRNLKHSKYLKIGFEADWDKAWEPFYISKREVPLYDERFKQYGGDRIEQICELYVAGYTDVELLEKQKTWGSR